jgi:predicted GIY-YIG superfamily endonuclease
MEESLKQLSLQITNLTEDCGVYIFKNAEGNFIYIGSAKNLRQRCMSHLSSRTSMLKASAIINASSIVESIVTKTIGQAKDLERSLIEKHKPKYNTYENKDSRIEDVIPKQVLNVIINSDLHRNLKVWSAKRNISLKTYINRILEAYVYAENKAIELIDLVDKKQSK